MDAPKKLKTDHSRKAMIKAKMGLTEPKNLPKRVVGALKVPDRKMKRKPDVDGGPLDKTMPGIALILGSSMSGKTTLMVNLLLQKSMFGGMFDVLHICSPTIEVDDAYQLLIGLDETRLHSDFTIDTEREIKEAMKVSKQEGKGMLHQGVVLDDGVSSQASSRGSALQSFGSVARHYCDLLLISTQDLKATALPKFRNQIRLYIVMRNTSEKDRKGLFQELGAYFGGDKNLQSLFDKATEGDNPYSFLILNVPNRTAWAGFNELLYTGYQ